jgi:hypothetical protein
MSHNLTPDQQIKAIHDMMERSSRFLHISGFAGVIAGMIALLAAWIAQDQFTFTPDSLDYDYTKMGGDPWNILLLGLGTLIISFGLGFMLARRNARKHGASSWTATSRKMLGYFATPLLTGGLVIALFWLKGWVAMAAPLSLIFYGLALLHASHFTLTDIRYLGIIEVILGLAAIFWIQHSLIIWGVGFGIVHIGYGMYIYIRYERISS